MPHSSKHHQNEYKLQDPYHESDLQEKLCRYFDDGNAFDHVAEVKIVTGGTLNFNKFEPQQLPSLVAASRKRGKYHKLTDASFGSKPFDYICCVNMPAYVVCQFWKNIQQEICYFMRIEEVMKIKNSGAKALKESDFMLRGHTVNLAKYKKGIKR